MLRSLEVSGFWFLVFGTGHARNEGRVLRSLEVSGFWFLVFGTGDERNESRVSVRWRIGFWFCCLAFGASGREARGGFPFDA